MNNTLYEITDKYLKVLDNLEIDEETGEILNAEELDELSGAFEEKSEAVACYIKNSEVFIGDLKAEEANLAKRRKQTEKRIDYLKNVLTACLDAAGRDKVETTKVRVSFRKSVAVSIDDEKALPADFVVETVTTKPDKTAIKKAIQSGQEVSGASLVENRNLQIKRLVWSTNKKDRMNHLNGCNMTVHRDYANKACPGDYLYKRHGEIAAEVNRRLGASAEKPAENKPATGEVIHTVKAGETLSKIAQKYGTTYQKIAAYNRIANANLIRVGQKIKIPADTQAAQSFKKGDKVKVLKAVTYTGKAFKTYYDKYDVIEADGDRVVIGIGKTVTAAVNAANLKKA